MKKFSLPLISSLLIMLSLVNSSKAASDEATEIRYVSNLAKESAEAYDQGKIFLLYVSRPDCPYCERLKKDVLHPLLKGKRFDQKLLLRELSLSDVSVVDFDNRRRTANKLLAKYEIVGTPTLLFLDHNGEQLSDKLSGYFSKDFYWSYFESAISRAIFKLKSNK